MKLRVFILAVFGLILSGCVNIPDSQGWGYSQKSEFVDILKSDKYLSICQDTDLANRVIDNRNSTDMTQMLYKYANNLANGCINLASFKAAQNARKNDDFKTHFSVYKQKVSKIDLQNKLKAGWSIEQILSPYIPKYREFERLTSRYKSLKSEGSASVKTLYKLRLNIERVKLLKPNVSNEYILINIPEFKVRIIENGLTKLAMKVVVGKYNLQTPVFGEDLQYVVLNPQWNVPDSIARKEIIPKSLRNPHYLKAHNMEIHRDYNLKSPKLSLSSVNAKDYVGGKGPVPFKFIQIPSKKNGLGRVKFLFPNHYSVYMHDTQSKYLFQRSVRMFSHGCIRLEKPNKMLQYIITHYTNTPWPNALEMYNDMKTHYIKVSKRLPVHTAYFTMYIDDDGVLREFKDIYDFDRLQRLKFNQL
jgi:hypothetical protein